MTDKINDMKRLININNKTISKDGRTDQPSNK
jgi:hypothetical protein